MRRFIPAVLLLSGSRFETMVALLDEHSHADLSAPIEIDELATTLATLVNEEADFQLGSL